jgi:hypothetical protein
MEDKNLYKSRDYDKANQFDRVFHKRYESGSSKIEIGQRPDNMGVGGRAIDILLNTPISKLESVLKAVGGVPGQKAGRRVYVAPGEAPPKGITLYRGKEGGRFYLENEFEQMKGSPSTRENKPDYKKEHSSLSDRVKSITEKMEKEYNNLGNTKPRNPVNRFQPDLPQNQGVFKGKNLATEYTQKPASPKFEAPQGTVKNIKPPKIEKEAGLGDVGYKSPEVVSKSISRFLAKQNNPFAIATAQAKKMGYHNFKEGTPGEKKVDDISEAIKGTKKVEKQNLPSFNPTGNPMTGMGNKVKAQGIKNKLLAGQGQAKLGAGGNMPSSAQNDIVTTNQPQIPKTIDQRNQTLSSRSAGMSSPKIQAPAMRSRGPRNIPFAQFSLADRINKYIQKNEKK